MCDAQDIFQREKLIERSSIYAALQACLNSERMRGTANSELRAQLEGKLKSLFFPTIKKVVADSGATISLSYRRPEFESPDDQGDDQYQDMMGVQDMRTYSQVVEDNVRLHLSVVYRSGYRSGRRAQEAEAARRAAHRASQEAAEQSAEQGERDPLGDAGEAGAPGEAGVPGVGSSAEPAAGFTQGPSGFRPRPSVLPIAQINDLTLVGFGKRFPACDDGSVSARGGFSAQDDDDY